MKLFKKIQNTGKTVVLCRLIWFMAILLTASKAWAQKNPEKKTDTTITKKIIYGIASYYADKFHGRTTANGEIFDQKKMTCACNVLPLGTWIKVTCLSNNRSVVLKTNDRLHPRIKRVVDLTKAAAIKLGFTKQGITKVKVEVLKKAPSK